MIHYLVATAMGPNRPGMANAVMRLISECGCQVVDSRLAIFGGEFTFIMLLSGDWNALTRVETTLPRQGQELDLITLVKRTSAPAGSPLPLQADAVVQLPDEPGILGRFTQFFADKGWDLQELQTRHQSLPEGDRLHAGFQLNLPSTTRAAEYQQQFTAFCHEQDALQLDFTCRNKE